MIKQEYSFLSKILYHDQVIRFVKFFKTYFFNAYAIKSYSQEGEDMILRRLFEHKKYGFYVDVGAHHPKRFSNTYFFYRKGWSGINIDAMPGSMRPFRLLRSRDINLETAVSQEKKELIYYMFNEPALNGFSEQLSENEYNTGNYYVVAKKKLTTRPLFEILDKYLPKGQEIDFLTVDVESLDFEVLKSNNWEKYNPKAIVVELLHSTLEELGEDEMSVFLQERGYRLFAKAVNTVIFVLKTEMPGS
jgi:hypothetical protein